MCALCAEGIFKFKYSDFQNATLHTNFVFAHKLTILHTNFIFLGAGGAGGYKQKLPRLGGGGEKKSLYLCQKMMLFIDDKEE